MEEKHANYSNRKTQMRERQIEQEVEQDWLSLSINDIELILVDQSELYSNDEISLLRDRLAALRAEEDARKNLNVMDALDPSRREIKERLAVRGAEERKQKQNSDVIKCPKCDGENPSSNQRCQYCSHILKVQPKDPDKTNNRSLRLIAFFIPIIGILIGLVYIGKGKDELGKSLIIFAVAGAIVMALIGWLLGAGVFNDSQRTCHYCGDVVSGDPVEGNGRYYCSQDCLYREIFFGEGSGY